MVFIVVMMLVILAVCGVIVTYVAFPHRGAELPVAPWLGDAMSRAAEALPVLDETDADEGYDDGSDGHDRDRVAFADRW